MTPEKALEIKAFAKTWITKVVAKRKDYRERLLTVLDDLFPDDIAVWDPYDMLDCKNWDEGESYKMGNGRTCYRQSMSSRMDDLIEYDYESWGLSKKGKDDFICTIRIAIDLFIQQSGGVVGYTVGDLRKAFDGNIPEEIAAGFEGGDIRTAPDSAGVWL